MDIIGMEVKEIRGKLFDSNSLTYEIIWICFQKRILKISVDIDSDELLMELINDERNLNQLVIPNWSEKLKGRKVIAFWKGVNNMGYNDLFVMGLDVCLPNFCISSIASQLDVRFSESWS
ncbi:DUF6334 family protein [Labilibaculum euxinus]